MSPLQDSAVVQEQEREILHLYQRANAQQWNPDKDIQWEQPILLTGPRLQAWVQLIKIFYSLELMGLYVVNDMMNIVSGEVGDRHLAFYLSIQGTDEARHIYTLGKYLEKLGSGTRSLPFERLIKTFGKLASKGIYRSYSWAVSTLFSENFASHFMSTAIEKNIEPLGSQIFKRILMDESRHISLQHILCRRLAHRVGFFARNFLRIQAYSNTLLTAIGVGRVEKIALELGLYANFIDSFLRKLGKQEEALGLNRFINPRTRRKIFNWFLSNPQGTLPSTHAVQEEQSHS